MTPRLALLATAFVVVASFTLAADKLPPPADREIDFTKDVRPILEKNCWKCHGASKQESGLRLDSREALLKGGDLGQVISAKDSERSKLIVLVAGTDPQTVMPPDGPQLKAEEVGILRAWIDQGCVWPENDSLKKETKNTHWSYQPIRRPAVPANRHPQPVIRNPIDAFVLAELEKRGIKPSPEADRYTLIRRLNLDLLGLPPTIEEVDAFVNDSRPNAYEELVDRLLKSPHFGERWGRHWLDMARYADSDGYEKDNARPDAYRWRDWVIDAINNDMPFDQFTIEQLAGDLLPNATALQKLATAFHRQTLTNTEGGTDQEQWRVEACFDRTETTGAVWLGLTVGCARCHSHKYDAISQREYYQLFAAYNNGDETTSVVPKSPEEVAEYEKTKSAHDASVADLTAKLRVEQAKLGDAFATWETKTQAVLAETAGQPLKLHALDDVKVESDGGVKFMVQKDGSFLAKGANPASATYTITGKSTAAGVNALRLDVFADKSLPANGPGRVAHGNFVLSEMIVEVSPTADFANARKLDFAGAKADFEQADKPWRAADVIDGKEDTGWAIAPQFGKDHWAVFGLREPLAVEGAVFVRVQLRQLYGLQHTIGRFKVSLQTGIEPSITVPDNIQKLLAVKADQRNAEQKQQLLDYYSCLDLATKELVKQLDDLKKKEPPKPELTVRVVAQRINDPRKTFVLKRGEFLEPLKEQEVAPAGFSTLPTMKRRDEKATMADRLDLARWLVSPDNPLTPRVTVNHIWRQLFGRGVVASVNDFGVRGEKPSHPELLDWLASEFVKPETRNSKSENSELGTRNSELIPWSRKALIRLIVTSATYRQSSRHRDELLELDPQNTLLARQNRLRVEAEIVRDLSLDVAGLLSKKIGGPSVYPVLPPGITDLSYAGNFKWPTSTGEDRNRRGMYTFFKRTAPHPNLTTFDCPDANLTCVERRASNTPLQALITLNNETFLEASQAFAKRLLSSPADDSARLTQAFRLCVARVPNDRERQQLSDLLAVNREFYRAHQDDAKKLVSNTAISGSSPDETAAWIATARILLNLDEFITRE
jgi:hypothetical protein